jgi:hypothetical protein
VRLSLSHQHSSLASTLRALKYLVLIDWREHYTSLWIVAVELFAVVLGLAVYWYTARAFSPSHDYFSYVVFGEMAILLPLQFLHSIPEGVKKTVSLGVWDAMQSLPMRPQTPALLLGFSSFPRNLVRLLMTFVAANIIFHFGEQDGASGLRLLAAFGLQILALPTFIGIAMVASAMLIVFGRGQGAFYHAGAIAAICAGVYFPTSNLPPFIQSFSHWASPFGALLEMMRGTLNSSNSNEIIPHVIRLMVWGVVAFPLGYVLLGRSLEHAKRRGTSLPLGTS